MEIDRETYLNCFPARLKWAQERRLSPQQDGGMMLRPELLWLVRRGSAKVTTRNGTFVARPGQVLYAAPSVRSQCFEPGTVLLSIGLEDRIGAESWLVTQSVLVGKPPRQVVRLTERLCRRSGALQARLDPCGIRMLAGASAEPEAWLCLDALFLRWQAAVVAMARRAGAVLAAPTRAVDARVRRALATLAAQPWALSTAPAALAEAVGLSRRRLEQLVSAHTGTGVAELRAQHRLAQAKQLLRTPGAAVKSVAATLGFRTSTAFVLWFRRHAGCPPRRWLMARAI